VALDAASGKKLWNGQGCRDTSNSSYAMASYIYKGQLLGCRSLAISCRFASINGMNTNPHCRERLRIELRYTA
jgi:hypothetical protein